jgi:hypothetical protein
MLQNKVLKGACLDRYFKILGLFLFCGVYYIILFIFSYISINSFSVGFGLGANAICFSFSVSTPSFLSLYSNSIGLPFQLNLALQQ